MEQIEQETLEEQGHALLHSWQTAVCVADVFQEKGLVKSAQQMRRVCDAAKQTIDKVLSPETIRAAPKPTIARVVADHTMVGQPEVACVVADRATEPHQQPRVVAGRATEPHQQPERNERATEPHHQPEVARVVSDRATQPDHHVACVVADRAAVNLTKISHRRITKVLKVSNGRWRTCCRRWNNVVCVFKEEEKYRVISQR